jgi:hypothetical protein
MKQEILNRLNAAYDATQNCCIAMTLSNYIDTVEGISEEEFDREVYEWYDKALTDFGFPKVGQLIAELRMNQIVFVPNELRTEFENEVNRRGLIVFGGMMNEHGQFAYID